MARFTRYNNPSKKHHRRFKSWEDKQADICKAIVIDSRLGYNLPLSFYTKEEPTYKEDLSAMVTISEVYYYGEPETATMSKADLIDLLPELYADEGQKIIDIMIDIVKGMQPGETCEYGGHHIEA